METTTIIEKAAPDASSFKGRYVVRAERYAAQRAKKQEYVDFLASQGIDMLGVSK